MKADLFEAPDYYNLDDLLSEEHKLVRRFFTASPEKQ